MNMYLERCNQVAEKGTCPRRKVGAIIIDRFGREISYGYNGSPHGEEHCVDVGCIVGECPLHGDGHCKRAVHAEVNAIALAAKAGRSTDGCTLYCNITVCPNCRKIAMNAGIKEIINLTHEDKYV